MTPETEQAPAGQFRRPRSSHRGMPPARLSAGDVQAMMREAGAPVRSAGPVPAFELEAEAARARLRDASGRPSSPAPRPAVAAQRARGNGSIVDVLPYLAVLICTIAGVYMAWHQGSAGGGRGGIVGGLALLVAAVFRLALPDRLTGLLSTRNRAIDVLTLTIFGGGLLAAGLVLPR